MKRFISQVQNLSQKAAEMKAAIQQVPPKVAEIREAVTATTGQLQQLKSEIQFSVADLKANEANHLSEALQELNSSADVFAKAGFVLAGVDIEISPVQRALVHLLRAEDVTSAVLRALVQANQHRRTTRAILSSLLQAKQMADTVELGGLAYDEVIVGIGPIPSVRLCWRMEERATSPEVQPPSLPPSVPPLAASAPLPAAAPAFSGSSFFERRESPAPPQLQTLPSSPVERTEAVAQKVATSPAAVPPTGAANDPLARFKKMPVLTR